jgi:hypothetical protein
MTQLGISLMMMYFGNDSLHFVLLLVKRYYLSVSVLFVRKCGWLHKKTKDTFSHRVYQLLDPLPLYPQHCLCQAKTMGDFKVGVNTGV